MRSCREYLIRIISATTGIDANLLRDNIELVTSEVNSNVNTVNSVVDAVYKDNKEYFNIEINYNYSHIATVKNNIYLYNMILRQVGNSKEYKDVLQVIQININNYDIFKKGEFIYKTQIMEDKYHEVRDEMITIYDINLEYLSNIDYNEIIEGNYNLEKILYIFICKDKNILDYIYNGDKIMEKVREESDNIKRVLDEMLYYDPKDLERQILEYEIEQAQKRGYEKGHKEGLEKGIEQGIEQGIKEGEVNAKKEIVLNMYNNNFSILDIVKCTNLNAEKIKEILNI